MLKVSWSHVTRSVRLFAIACVILLKAVKAAKRLMSPNHIATTMYASDFVTTSYIIR